jgi:hypothetical protein
MPEDPSEQEAGADRRPVYGRGAGRPMYGCRLSSVRRTNWRCREGAVLHNKRTSPPRLSGGCGRRVSAAPAWIGGNPRRSGRMAQPRRSVPAALALFEGTGLDGGKKFGGRYPFHGGVSLPDRIHDFPDIGGLRITVGRIQHCP